jgi:hypothetical protein
MVAAAVRLACLVAVVAALVVGSCGVAVAEEPLVPEMVYEPECLGQGPEHIAHEYQTKDNLLVPLRCGTSRYGYHHIQHRRGFDVVTDTYIHNCLLLAYDIEQQGTAKVYFCTDVRNEVAVRDRVVVETAAYGDGKPKGIITYYTDDIVAGTSESDV